MDEQAKTSIVRIYRRQDSKSWPIGCGFLVGGRSILTCWHVVRDALLPEKDLLGEEVELDFFPFTRNSDPLKAKVTLVVEQPDLAKLELLSGPPEKTIPMPLSTDMNLGGHPYSAFGITSDHHEGCLIKGEIMGSIGDGTIQLESKSVFKVEKGFSGTAIWDNRINRAVGMVVTKESDQEIAAAYAISMADILKKCPELKILVADSAPSMGETFYVPLLPKNFIFRKQYLTTSLNALLSQEDKDIAITGTFCGIGLQGMGGIGKSVLAAYLARDRHVLEVFVDGVIWIRLGQRPDLLKAQLQLIRVLDQSIHNIPDIEDGLAYIHDLLKNRSCLIILDDVWKMEHFRAFYAPGPKCKMLITTRDLRIVREIGACECQLDVLSDEESLDLLSRWSCQDIESLPPEAVEVAKECGNHPLALAMVGAMARHKPDRWKDILYRLYHADLEKIRADFPDYPYPTLMRALEVCMEALAPEYRDKYEDLAVFPEGNAIPVGALKTLWEMDNIDVHDLIDLLVDLSLAKVEEDGLKLHDLQHDFILKKCGDLTKLHTRLINSYKKRCSNGWPSGPDDGYFFDHLAYHLVESGNKNDLRDLLFNFRWFEAKLRKADIYSLISDFNFSLDEEVVLCRDALGISSHVLFEDPSQLSSQLLGRLQKFNSPGIIDLLKQAKEWNTYPSLRPLNASLIAPGGHLVRTLAGHIDRINDLVLTPDDKHAISASSDGTLKVWDILEGKELKTLSRHNGIINAVSLTPDGRRAVSASNDLTLKIWDIYLGKELMTLKGHNGWVNAVTITPDGKKAISASYDRTLRVWDLENGQELKILRGHNHRINTIALTPDGRRAVSSSNDGTLKVWDIGKGQELKTLEEHRGEVVCLALTPEGNRAISGSDSGVLTLWDLERGQKLITLSAHSGRINKVVLTPDGKRAISASSDKTLKIWDLETGQELRAMSEHSGVVNAVAITPDGKRVISGLSNGALRVWDLEKEAIILDLPAHKSGINVIALTSDGKKAISASNDKTLKIFDLKEEFIFGKKPHIRSVAIVGFTPNGKRAVSASYDGTLNLKVWNPELAVELTRLSGHKKSILALALTPDSKRVVSSSTDRTLKIWDLETGQELKTLRGHNHMIKSIALTPDGKRIISGSSDRTLKIWDLETGQELKTLRGHKSWVNAVAITPDGKRIISGSSDRTLKIWDLETGQELKTLRGHMSSSQLTEIDKKHKNYSTIPNHILTIALTSDGKRAVSIAYESTLYVWDLKLSDKPRQLSGHKGLVRDVVLTPDGRRAVSSSNDGTLKIWDLETCNEIMTLKGHCGAVMKIALTSDGKRAISVSQDHSLKLWDIEKGSNLATFTGDSPMISCTFAPNGLTILAGDIAGNLHFLRIEGLSDPIIGGQYRQDDDLKL